jgi:hypothetical protein
VEYICIKISAKIKDDFYVLRGCVLADPGIANVCEDIDNGLTIEGEKVKNAKVCFCDENGCNAAQQLNLIQLQFLIGIAFLIQYLNH